MLMMVRIQYECFYYFQNHEYVDWCFSNLLSMFQSVFQCVDSVITFFMKIETKAIFKMLLDAFWCKTIEKYFFINFQNNLDWRYFIYKFIQLNKFLQVYGEIFSIFYDNTNFIELGFRKPSTTQKARQNYTFF